MSSSGFGVIRRHSSDAAGIRIKELTQELARQRSQISGSQLETDDVRSQGRMDHSTIKLNDERLKFATTLSSSDFDFFYEFPNEPDFDFLKVWFMLDHLGTRIRDMSGFGNDGIVSGHPTLRRESIDLGFQQTTPNTPASPAMLFNSGLDFVSQRNGEYIWIPDNPSIKFTQFAAGFSITFRFVCYEFRPHVPAEEPDGSYARRFAAKTDDALNGWSVIVFSSNAEGTQGGIEFEILHNNVGYARAATGFNAGQWYQVVVTYDPNQALAANRIKIYTEGTENSVLSTFGTLLPVHTNLRIGARDSQSGFFYGFIHDFRMYMGKVLTQTEITNLNQNEMTIDNITKGHTFIVQYAMVSQVLRLRTHRYNVGGYIIRDRTHKFNIIQKITRTRTHKWNTFVKVTITRTHKFNIIKQVIRTRTHKFSMGGHLTLTKTHKFNIINKITTTKTHRYSMGGIQVQYVRFQKSTGANGTTQDVTFNSTPQAIIVWTDGSTVDNTYNDNYYISYGFSDGTNHAAITGFALDNAATADTFSGYSTNKVITYASSSAVVGFEATVSFSTNKATFTWTTNDASARYIHCMAIWNANAVEVKNFTTGQTTTGTRAYSFNNSALVPRFIHAITRGSSPASYTSSFGNTINIGAGISSSKQFSVANMSLDGSSTMVTSTAYSTTNTILQYDDDNPHPLEGSAAYSSATAGSITLNWTDAPTATNNDFSILAIDSTAIDIGVITQPNGVTGTQVTNTGTTIGPVRGLMIFSNMQSSGTQTDDSAMTIGAASGTGATDQGLITAFDDDLAATSIAVRAQRTGAITRTFTGNTTSASSTTTTEASVSNLGTNQFTLNWTTADSNTRKFHYIAFGS